LMLQEGWKVFVVARNKKAIARLSAEFGDEILKFIYCDLSDLSSVKEATETLMKSTNKIDVLMNNAGAWFMSRQETKDGFEMTFGMNHLGHFLLTTELMDLLISSKTRIINISSMAHRNAKLNFEDLMWERRKYRVFEAYGQSKLANIYFSNELHRRFYKDGISSFSLHPGVVATNFGNANRGWFSKLYNIGKYFMISPEKGAETQIYLASADNVQKYSGMYFEKCKPVRPAKQALEIEPAGHLWEISSQLVAPFR